MHGHESRVSIDEEISVGIEANVESQGTKLSSVDGQITTATTTTLLTASAGKVILIKRCSYSIDVDQSNANGSFKIQGKDGSDVAQSMSKVWNPKTSAEYGVNVAPDYVETGTAKTVEIVTPTGFTDKLDWVLLYQEIDDDV